MYRVFLYFAFLALCSSTHYGGDRITTRTFVSSQPEQQFDRSLMPADSERRDETDLVDATGSGYSYFRHQTIVARPIEEQRVAASEPGFSKFADNSNNYADYTKASAFKTLSGPNGYGSSLTRDELLPEKGPYGSAISAVQPTTRIVNTGYGQPQIQEKTVVTIKSNNGYGSQVVPDNRVLLREGYGQEKFVQPSIRIVNTGYGQPQIQEKTVVTIKSNNGYGSQVLPDNRVLLREGYGQEKFVQPTTRIVNTGYGSQVPTDNRVLLREGYGQQKFVQPTTRIVNNGYRQ